MLLISEFEGTSMLTIYFFVAFYCVITEGNA